MKTIISSLCIVGAIGIFFFYTEAKRAEIKIVQADIRDYEEAIKQSEDVLARKQELAEKYQSFKKEDIENLEKLLPDHVDNIQLVMDLNNIARKYGMSLKSVEMQNGPSDSFTTQNSSSKEGAISVSFTVSAQYDIFLKFMEDVEKSLRIVDVTDLTFQVGDKNVYDFALTIKTYWLK